MNRPACPKERAVSAYARPLRETGDAALFLRRRAASRSSSPRSVSVPSIAAASCAFIYDHVFICTPPFLRHCNCCLSCERPEEKTPAPFVCPRRLYVRVRLILLICVYFRFFSTKKLPERKPPRLAACQAFPLLSAESAVQNGHGQSAASYRHICFQLQAIRMFPLSSASAKATVIFDS